MARVPVILAAITLAAGVIASTASAAAPNAAIPSRPELSPIDNPGGEPRVALSPVRFNPQPARPGVELRYPLQVRNTTNQPVTLTAVAIPLAGSRNPDRYAEFTDDGRAVDAVDWVSFPGFGEQRVVPPDHQLRFPAAIRVPAGAAPGTYALGLAVSQRVSAIGTNSPDQAAPRVRLALDLASVAVVRVAGTAASDLRLRDVSAPRIVWSGQQPTFRARVENVGDTDLVIDSKVDLSSFLSAAGRTLNLRGPEKGYPTLPGGRRTLEMRWTDPPLLGWYQPQLVIVGGTGSGVRITDQLDTVYVLPPWWLLLLLLVAIWLPLRGMRRRRRDPEWDRMRRARAGARVEARMKKDAAKRRAIDARRRR